MVISPLFLGTRELLKKHSPLFLPHKLLQVEIRSNDDFHLDRIAS